MISDLVPVMVLFLLEAPSPSKDYTSVFVSIAIFFLLNFGSALIAWGSTSARLKSVQEKLSDLPSKAEMGLAVANLKAELLLVMDTKIQIQSKDLSRRTGDKKDSSE